MQRTPSIRVVVFVLATVFGLLRLGTSVQGQREGLEHSPAALRTIQMSGSVVAPQGSPAAGVVIVSSAGGQAVSGIDGRFELSVELSPEIELVHVTVVAPAGMTAHTQLRVDDRAASADVGTLILSQAQDCSPAWLPTFGGEPGASHIVNDLVVFDDGTGPALYAGGTFTFVSGVAANQVARWDGSSWSALGSGINGSFGVSALAVFDDGSGPALYAGGEFFAAGGVPAQNIARWDGSSWSALASGVDGSVSALAVFDDGSGSGPALYAGGDFDSAGGVTANHIAKWDGSTWSALGDGMAGTSPFTTTVRALAVLEELGPALFAGGKFTSAGGAPAANIARWDGSAWETLGSGVDGTVHALCPFDDGRGGGTALFVGGEFANAGGAAASHVAKWDGASWSPLEAGLEHSVLTLIAFDEGSGSALYAGGSTSLSSTTVDVWRWDGVSWSTLGSGMSGEGGPNIRALAVFDDGSGSGPLLYVGGDFLVAGGSGANRLAKWDGTEWTALSQGGVGNDVSALAVFDDGSGPALYAGGSFLSAGGQPANRIAKWDGSSWSALGSGITEPPSSVLALAAFDDGSGPALYVGGDFLSAGGVTAKYIARWNGSSWSSLGNATGPVYDLTVFDSGSGPALYAAGAFKFMAGVSVNEVAKWNGSVWSALGTGMGGPAKPSVFALAAFDDGTGTALYAGGDFTIAGGVTAHRVAKWNGSAWSPLGSGMNGLFVHALAVFDDGTGPELYAGGSFSTAGVVAASRIARWNGSSWAALGSGVSNTVQALAVYDDGGGPALFACGNFSSAGGAAANRIAKWDGSTWSPLGGGLNNPAMALTVFDDGTGNGEALIVGGNFERANDSGDSYLAKWAGCPVRPPVWTDLGFGLAGTSGIPDLSGTGTLVAGSPGSLTLTNAKPVSLTNLFVSFASVPTPFKGGTLVPVPPALTLTLFTNGVGSIPLAWPAWPAGVPSGSSLFFQYGIADPAAPAGVALSNALHAVTP